MKKYFLLSSVLVALVLLGCGLGKVRMVSIDSGDAVELYRNLNVKLSKDLCPEERLNQWDTLAYLIIEPPVFGRFMWTEKNVLTFSPAMGFAPATDYTIRLNPAAFEALSGSPSVSDAVMKFSTEPLDIQSVHCFWNMHDGKKAIQFYVSFNYDIQPSDLQALLKVTIDKKNYAVEMENERDQENAASFYVFYPDDNSPSSALIEVGKGMACYGCGLLSQKEIVAEVMIPSLDVFSVTSYEASIDLDAASLMLRTSQPVDETNVKKNITVSPTVKNLDISVVRGGILLRGDFDQEKNYTVTISKDLKSVFGILLKEDYQVYATFAEPAPFLAFDDDRSTYLSLKGERNLSLRAANVQTVELSVFRIYENNIQNYLRDGYEWGWYYDYDSDDGDWYDYTYYPKNRRYGDPVFSKQIEMKQLQSGNGQYLLKLDPAEMRLDDRYKGLYVITIEDKERAWLQSSIMLSMSDIGLVVHEGVNGFMACAVSIQDGKPLAGVKITLISDNNQEILSEVTNADGVIMINDVKKRFNGFTVGMVTARKDEDFNYLSLNRSRVNTSRYDLSGKWTENLDFDVLMYGDRDLYRPGDSVHVNAIVRNWNFETVKDIPVCFKVQNPLGETVERYRKTLQENGFADISFVLPSYAPTGFWNISFENAAGVVQKNYVIHVEEFMPDRIKVTATTNKTQYNSREPIILEVEAVNLYGPPAAGRNYETSLTINHKQFTAAKFPEYDFYINKYNYRYLDEDRSGTTDDKGCFTERFKPDFLALSGAYSGSLYTTVFDENGRPVNRMNRFDVFTQETFLGVKRHDYWFGTSAPINFGLIAVNTSGELSKADNVRVVIERSYYENVQVRVGNSNKFEYRSQQKTETVYDKKMTVNGNETAIAFTPKISGSYTLKMYLSGSEYYMSSSFYAYGYDATSSNSFAVDKEGSITIELDKKEYEPGDKAKILFTAPFSGKMLVTVECDKVKDYQWVTLENKSASLSLNIKNEYMPNCYITATAFRNFSENNNIPLTVARGYDNITIRKSANMASPSIEAVEKSRSGTKQTIKVKGMPGSHLSIAVVDEGILQITDFKTPDPYSYFYGRRALEVESYDLYPFLFKEIFGKSSSGGDGGLDMSQMVNPMTNKRVKLVSFWSGVLKTDGSGRAQTEIDIPQFSGSLRIMVVNWKDNRFGSASKNMIVADPIVVSSGIPRFFSPNDEPKIPVVLRNTTEKDAQVKVSMNVSPLLTIVGDKNRTVNIKAGKEETCFYDVVAQNDVGEAFIEVKAQAFSETFTEKTDISIRPPTGFTSKYYGGAIKAGTPFSMSVGEEFISSTAVTNMMFSSNLAAQYAGELSEVMYYPYGCLEQTTSRAFPLLYLDDLATTLEKAKSGGQTTRYVINESIKRIMSMRTSNGGLGYWPGSSDINMWSECYAAHFLTEASKAGYTVDAEFMRRLLLHITAYAKTQQWDEYHLWNESTQSYKPQKRIAKPVIYALYVLALNGKQEISQMNFYKNSVQELTPDMRCMLASAYAVLGNMPACNELLNFKEDNPKTQAMSGGDFSSYIRNNALMLSCLSDADPNDPRIPALALQLNKNVKDARYLSTQEKAFTLLAFGKLARKAGKNSVTATIALGGKNIGTFDGKNFTWKGNKGETGTLNVTSQGTGELYYFVETSGIPTNPVPETDNQLKVRKRFLNKNGQEVDLNNVKQGDLIFVEVAVQTTNTLQVQNVAIQDVLPACFEIENSRLSGDDRTYPFMKSSKVYPDYLDIRDDRITAFTTVTPTIKYFYYSVRAVSTGTYIMGAINATAMYDGNYNSTFGNGRVTVR
ncbi:MAG: MG2 domain-containing protein [Bacteroidales bacterium]|nr:MG2 domain-containing protein [Bacteroidales bacterium]